jgi:hypothetical protein
VRVIRIFISAIFLLAGPWSQAADPVDPMKLAAIKELITVTGAATNSEQYSKAFSQQLVSVLRMSNPELSEDAVEIVNQEVGRTVREAFSAESLQQEIYPIYAHYFTLEELHGLLSFNKSPAGIKANQVMPQLMAESMQAAQLWSRAITPQISRRVLERFQKEGIQVRLTPTGSADKPNP